MTSPRPRPRRMNETRSGSHSRLDPALPQGATPSETGLLGPIEVKAICDALGIRPTKVLGQNFVHDAGTVRRIVRAGAVEAGDEVLEVGPGLGSLTLALLETGARVRAIEIDPPLAHALPATVHARMPEAAQRLRVTLKDATTIRSVDDIDREAVGVDGDPTVDANQAWPAPTKLVANLPYNVAVPVLLALLEALPTLSDVLVMVQAEVADRLAAPPGSRTYGVPSVKAAWYGHAERAGTIGRTVFWPVPGVDSALVRLRRYDEPLGDDALRQGTFEIADIAFGQRRKTLRAALKTWAGSSDAATTLLERAGIDPSARGETLDIHAFCRLGRHVQEMRAEGLLTDARPLRSPQKQEEPHA